MSLSALSVNGVNIRLPDERWDHIAEEHGELAGLKTEILETVSAPESVHKGTKDELLALRMVETGKALVVVYKEVDADDGFVITAFLSRRLDQLERRTRVWPPQEPKSF